MLTYLHPLIFKALINLEFLDLEYNQINSLNPVLLQKVFYLTLSSNRLIYIDPLAFKNMTVLTELAFRDNQISYLNDTIFNGLTMLTELSFYRNLLISLSEQIFSELTSLVTLRL